MKSICRWTRRRLPLLAGGDLVGPERRLAERHVVGCPACRRHLASLRDVLGVLHEVAEAEILAPAAPPLWTALEQQIREARRPERPVWPRRAVWAVSAALAASLVGVLALVFLHRGGPAAVMIVAQTRFIPRPAATISVKHSPLTPSGNARTRRKKPTDPATAVLPRPNAHSSLH